MKSIYYSLVEWGMGFPWGCDVWWVYTEIHYARIFACVFGILHKVESLYTSKVVKRYFNRNWIKIWYPAIKIPYQWWLAYRQAMNVWILRGILLFAELYHSIISYVYGKMLRQQTCMENDFMLQWRTINFQHTETSAELPSFWGWRIHIHFLDIYAILIIISL